jgi:ribosomal protein L13E
MTLNRSGLTFLQMGRILNLPELINNQWVRRYDISVDLRRKITRQYNIQSLVDAPVQFLEIKTWHRAYLFPSLT